MYKLLSYQIKRIYKENSKIYEAPKIHIILNIKELLFKSLIK